MNAFKAALQRRGGMINKKKLVFFSFLFFIVFTIIGDAYIYYLDGKFFESDFKYSVDLKNKNLKHEYVRDLKKYSKKLNLKLYVVSMSVTSKNAATYTVYSLKENKDSFKKRIQVKKDHSKFNSLLNGERIIIFKPLKDIVDINEKDYFYVFGKKENVYKLRSATIDKYGMSKPKENGYSNDATFMITTAWVFIFVIIFIYTAFEVNNLKKEVLIRYLNGTNKKNVIRPLIIKNTLVIISGAIIGMLLGMIITESYKFLSISAIVLAVIIFITNSLYLRLYNLDVKKTFVKSYYTYGYKLLALFVLSLISIILILTLTFNFKNIYDAALTINQEDNWEDFFDYDNIFFLFKEYTKNTNMKTDEKYAVKFYNENIDRYKIHLSFDFSNNGGYSSSVVNGNDPIVYLNKYAQKEIKNIGVNVNKLKKDTYYIISRFSDNQLKEKGIYDKKNHGEINYLLDNNEGTFETITIKSGFKLLIYDINMMNLADNYKSNPIILFDTHSVLPSKEWSGYVFNSLVKFQNKNDYNNFIRDIGYQDEVHYKNNIKELYEKKRAEKMLVLIINVILSSMVMILFNISLLTILKMDFDSRAIEVALDKVFGKRLFKRYKGLFRLLTLALTLGLIIAMMGKILFYNFHFVYIIFSGLIVFVNVILILSVFINRYEKNSIPRILKGGI